MGREHHGDVSSFRDVQLLATVNMDLVFPHAATDIGRVVLDVVVADMVVRGGGGETVDGAEDELRAGEGVGGDGAGRQAGGEIPGYSLRSPAAGKTPV